MNDAIANAPIDLSPFWLSLKLSLVTTLFLLFSAFPIAYIFARRTFRFKRILEAVTALPLVLPPTVLGFYILLLLSPESIFGQVFEAAFGERLVFNFGGMIIASCIFSFPFMFQPLKSGLEQIDRALLDASYTLGKSELETLFRIVIPNMKATILGASIVTFAHTMGEFGVVLMIGGNIPNETRVASVAIYDKVEQLDFFSAHIYSAILVGFSFAVLLAVNYLNRGKTR
ncbi:molybdate ABC transporter, inner membrane subunit [Chloroherpeton thalassium ATCC 35110]|uniref:Molybdenum transport system permease n=1 Tax=Chloroherpeton thalassium (strain ATCC 35110 / GB-78) TaxID=517418 RepID=B3QUW4_CHLT3|nr:molybdate ABC transporter permease subunit [Chloroherpeton thalassium]ACF14465.1 molybdate ABC transporter, inner membrane subunit [Chloroherpeton thalassium ATCC 35110]